MPIPQSLSKLWRFPGGLSLDYHKAQSTQHPVIAVPLPKQLVLPLQQHIGAAAKTLVREGERVLKGQPIARADGYVSAYLHAPSSGTIIALEERPIAHPSGLSSRCLVMETDSLDEWCELPSPLPDFLATDPAKLRRRVREAGIVGLGGAAFPAAVKLNAGPNTRIDLLILNAAECEPYITCDDMLMREHPHKIIDGLLIMRHMLQVKDVIIGIEDNKPEAHRALSAALSELGAQTRGIRIQRVPTIYPAGGEKQLIRVLTGKEVPSNGIPAEIGIVCHNVGTAVAVFDAIMAGRPLISRYVTVTGSGVNTPCVLEAPIGTLISDLIARAGGYTASVQRLIMGGPMMGFALNSDALPIVKGTNCILATEEIPLTATRPALPCIRCGSCADACPVSLLPQQLYWYAKAKEFDKTQDYNLFDCIECGCCSAVCPSHIPLVQYYRFAKTEIWAQEREKQKSDMARQRHEFRLQRLELEKRERAEKMRKKKDALKTPPTPRQDPKKAAIEAALARAKAKKAQHDEASAKPPARDPNDQASSAASGSADLAN